MLAIVGATGSTLVSYILPGLVYTVLFANDLSSGNKWEYNGAVALLVIGCCIIPVCLTFIFI